MRLVVYEKYPIFDPAEGGIYYEGRAIREVVKVKGRKNVKAALEKLFEEYKEFAEDFRDGYARLMNRGFSIGGRHIGEGYVCFVERNRDAGCEVYGWHPYC